MTALSMAKDPVEGGAYAYCEVITNHLHLPKRLSTSQKQSLAAELPFFPLPVHTSDNYVGSAMLRNLQLKWVCHHAGYYYSNR
jgi:hypothetical protein